MQALDERSRQQSSYRVLVVDDSKAMCAFLSKVIAADPQLEVVGTAHDPYEARELIKQLKPDILTLDIEMPRMDGLTFLRNLMRLHPMPVVMISSMTSAGAAVSLEALEIGAVDFMVKRQIESKEQLEEYSHSIQQLVRSAARARITPAREVSSALRDTAAVLEPAWQQKLAATDRAAGALNKVICIGASTGGPEAVRQVLEDLEVNQSAVVIAQHMPTRFISAFAERLDKSSQYRVEESYAGAPLLPGHCYVAAGGSHTTIARSGTGYICQLDDGEKVNGHQPAVDSLFTSAANTLGSSALGLLLTGMGNDGAQGLKSMRDAGAFTVAQDQQSSAVWGMPGSAVKLEAADAVLPLHEIGTLLSDVLRR